MSPPQSPGQDNFATAAPSTMASSLFRQVIALEPIAWQRFVNVYGPVVSYWCRCEGIHANDTADVGQEVFRAVANGIQNYQRRSGVNFAAWLRTVTRNKAVDHQRRQSKRPLAVGGSTFLQRVHGLQQSDEDSPASANEPLDATSCSIMAHSALAQLKDQFQPKTWEAFWQTAVNDRSSNDVADELGMTAMAVRKAKSRVLRRLRDELTLAADGLIEKRQ